MALFLSCDIEWHVGGTPRRCSHCRVAANVPAFSGYRFSLEMTGHAAINYAAAKSDELRCGR